MALKNEGRGFVQINTTAFQRFALIIFTIACSLKLFAQPLSVETSVGTFTACPKTSFAIPISVKNLINVDTLLLTLRFDPAIAAFNNYQNPNPALTGGVLKVDNFDTIVRVAWYSVTPATILNDTLIELVFTTNTGITPLHWSIGNPTNCFYHELNSSRLPAIYIDGSLTVFSKPQVTLTQLDQTCIGQCKADLMATVTGGKKPYKYLWNNKTARFDSIQTNLCDGLNEILVTDANNCQVDSLYWIKGLASANVQVNIEPDSVIYLQNPTLKFNFESLSSVPIVEWIWRFGDGDTSQLVNPEHTYSKAINNQQLFYMMTLQVKNQLGCDTTIKRKLIIKEANITIPNVLTPNNDGVNDVFKVINANNSEYSNDGGAVKWEFLRMELYVFDRWGRKIYSDANYQNDWKPEGLHDGVYYYELKTIGYYRTNKYKGSITLLGSGL
jgi:PKD repeat protein